MDLLKYLELLKKCKTLASAGAVYVHVLVNQQLTTKEKDIFSDAYVEFTQNLKH
jgi:hypothetical protein